MKMKMCRFVKRTEDLGSYHRRLSMCDLFLDTPFYNAGSTTPTVLLKLESLIKTLNPKP